MPSRRRRERAARRMPGCNGRRRLRRGALPALGALVCAAGLVLSGCAPEPEPEPLSMSDAGGVYLDAVCPVNRAWDEADVEIDRLRLAVSRGERDTAAFEEAMLGLSEASSTAAAELLPEDTTWPEEAVAHIEAVRESLLADSEQATEVATLPAEEAIAYDWQGAEAAATSGTAARSALGLADAPETACAQRSQQLAEERAQQETDEKE